MKTKFFTSIELTSKWKNLLLTFYFLLFTFYLFSQAPQGFNYQAVARDSDNSVLANTNLEVKIGLLQGHGEPSLAAFQQVYASLSILYYIEEVK